MFRKYRSTLAGYDELRDATGAFRPHWVKFLSAAERLGESEIGHRWNEAQRLIYENAMAYSAYGDPSDRTRPWQLDPLPLLLSKTEWERVSEGLIQRVKLLELILKDLFGPQNLVKDGSLPPEVIYRHPGFRLAFHGQQPLRNRWLRFYAADLARAANGTWWVLGDRTEAPSGIGYALENRVVMSRMYPNAFRECFVQRLAPYFVAVQNVLHQLAPRNRDNPRIAILSQGPESHNYFEDAYLARYLGYTLVEGADLAVRNSSVMLKTLDGLLPVDVILRRPNSDYCDPLELDARIEQGTAGLLQAVRSRNLAVANTLGAGLVESPIFFPFLAPLCQKLLGEELKLPVVATWWCGTPAALTYVKENLDKLIIKPAFRVRGKGHQTNQQLHRLSSAELWERIRANPTEFVGQERVHRSTAPLWSDGALQTANIALRSYLVAGEKDYTVLPGGLTRTSAASDSLELSLLLGEGSKDTWVLDDEPVEQITLLPSHTDAVQLVRGRADLASRVADNLFWLGRNLERAEAGARVLRTVILRLTSEWGGSSYAELPSLIRLLAEQGQIEPGFAVEGIREQLPSIESALPHLVFDVKQAGSLRTQLSHIFRVAAGVRDRMSIDSWRIILRINEDLQPTEDKDPDLTEVLNLTNKLILHLSAFSGMMMESMTRTQIFRFLDLGRRLERALQILQLIECCYLIPSSIPSELMEASLEVADSLMTYRARYLANLRLAAALDLLLTDETNPRSLAFQLNAVYEHVEGLPREANRAMYTAEQRLAMSMVHSIRMVDIEAVAEAQSLGQPQQLANLLKDLNAKLPQLSNVISLRYLVHSRPSHQLGDMLPAAT